MIEKTFKSANSDATKDLLVVVEVDEGVNIHTESPVGRRGVSIAPSDAPALALAILEAAGVTETDSPYMQEAADNLRAYILIEEKVSAEARERAELEAEAFNLYRAYMAVHEPMNAIGDWQMLSERTKEKWLAVARRARELAKEATK